MVAKRDVICLSYMALKYDPLNVEGTNYVNNEEGTKICMKSERIEKK